MAFITLSSTPGTRNYWDSQLKVVNVDSFGSVSFSRPTYQLVDIIFHPDRLEKIYHNGSGDVTKVNYYPTGKMLYVGVPPNSNNATTEIIYSEYSFTSKAVNISSEFSVSPGEGLTVVFSLNSSVIVDSYCVGTTGRKIYHNGNGGINKVDVVNSIACGFVPPPLNTIITEQIIIEVNHDCVKNPVFLKWKNLQGGYDSWLFHTAQNDSIETSELEMFETYLLDENATGNIYSRGKEAERSLVLGASNLNRNRFEVIRHLALSPEVFILDSENNKTNVIVKTGSFSFETNNDLHDIEFEILLPKINTIK